MVKGVNKTVIVVNDTGNEMFEKIVFYVTPKYSKTNLKELNKAVGEFSAKFCYTKKFNKTTIRKIRFRKKLIVSSVIILSIMLTLTGFVLLF